MIKNMEVNDRKQCMKSSTWAYVQRWLNCMKWVALLRAAREIKDSASRDKNREWATHTYEEEKTEEKQKMQSVCKQGLMHKEKHKNKQGWHGNNNSMRVFLLLWILIGWRCQLLEA